MVAIGYVVFCVFSGIATSPDILLIARFFLGVTIGVSLVAVPVFVAESVAARIRGASLVAYQVSAVVGIILGFLLGAALADMNTATNWRIMLGTDHSPIPPPTARDSPMADDEWAPRRSARITGTRRPIRRC
jgi:SP family galactose:H+ symporter-like MFS transporter